MSPEQIAEAIADALDGASQDGGFWTVAHVNGSLPSVWVEASNVDTDGGAGFEFLVTVERQP